MTHEITLAQAVDMTSRYRDNRPNDYPLSESFELASIKRLFETVGAAKLRIYYGMKSDGKMNAILVVADNEGNDILPNKVDELAISEIDPVIIQDGYRCPPSCPPGSPLNE